MTAKAKKKKTTYQKHHEEWKENQEIFKRHPELSELLMELSKAKQAAEDSKVTYEALREQIGKIMKSHYFKIFSLASGLQVTISEIIFCTSITFVIPPQILNNLLYNPGSIFLQSTVLHKLYT